MIISVPKSLNLSHSSFVSKWQIIGLNSSQLQVPTIFGLLYSNKRYFKKKHSAIVDSKEYCTGSGVSLSSEGDGLGVVPLELFDVVRGVLDSASESLHCSTSTSNSSSPSVKRFIDAGPNLIKNQISYSIEILYQYLNLIMSFYTKCFFVPPNIFQLACQPFLFSGTH